MKDEIAIILVDYNGKDDTINCIRSIRTTEEGKKAHIVVVENFSNPNQHLEQALDRYNVKVLSQKENLGFGKANNIGVKWALKNTFASYILLLNNDTEISKGSLKALIQPLIDYPDVVISTCKTMFLNAEEKVWYGGGELNTFRGKPRITDYGQRPHRNGAAKSRLVDFASGCVMMFRAHDIIAQDLFFDDRFFMYNEDVELCLRVKQKGLRIYYTAETSIFHKVHGSHSERLNVPAKSPKNPNLPFHFRHSFSTRKLTFCIHNSGIKKLIFLMLFSGEVVYLGIKYLWHGRVDAVRQIPGILFS